MQTNTPTPTPPRNRRAGRMSPLPPVQDTPAPVPQQAAPAAPRPAAEPYARPAPGAVPQHAPQYAAPAPRPAAGDALHPLHGSMQQAAPRPVPRPVPTHTGGPGFTAAPRAVPAGTRPQAVGRTAPPVRRDDPEQRRAASRPRREVAREQERLPERKRGVPGWLKTVLTLAFIGVLALATMMLLVMAHLKTTNDAREAAWDTLLSAHHVTERDDGTLRVTWQDTIEHYADMYNLNPAFVTAIIRHESSFRTQAESSVGARGLMQMMEPTAKDVARALGEPYNFDNLYDGETAIRYGCWYLNYLAELFGGDTVLVCAAYHAGLGKVSNWLDDRSISPDGISVPIANIPIDNTRIYAERVTYAYGIYEMLLYPTDEAAAEPAAHSTSVRSNPAR